MAACSSGKKKNHLTAVPTAESRALGSVLVTFNIGEDQTQTEACYTAAALRGNPTMMKSAAEPQPQTSPSESCYWEASDVFIQREASSTSFLRVLASFFFCPFGWQRTFPGTIFNSAPPGVAGEWLSPQLH